MELEKIKNLSETELQHEEQKASEQLFRLRFQAKLGQTEGVKKIRGLRKDVARIKTIARQHQLGITIVSKPVVVAAGKSAGTKKAVAKKVVAKKSAAKKASAKKPGKTTKKGNR
jgi:large subunit ribosomal protein L29